MTKFAKKAIHPAPQEIRAAREMADLTQTEAAQRTFNTLRTWQDWEGDKRAMPWGLWELFLLKVGQHPDFTLTKRQQ